MEPRSSDEYSSRQVAAAHRVLIDVHQVLASFNDCLVLVGGWVPDLLLPEAEEAHVGSIDVDLALNVEKLGDGRYAELIQLLLDTRRYRPGEKDFQLLADVALEEGEAAVVVAVEFLAPRNVKLKKNRPKLLKEFRVLQADGCEAAFRSPVLADVPGKTIRGADNTVHIQVASISDFLIMKAHAIGGRDKPKDTYDFCYCLEHFPEGAGVIAGDWKRRLGEAEVDRAIRILREKFATVSSFGPHQMVEFHNSSNSEEREILRRAAYERVQQFLGLIGA